MEVYIDDMLVKSKEPPDHTTHLQQAFKLLRAYVMKLNLTKWAFGVSAGRFLGFMMTQRGIEANPVQLQAILESPAPSSKKGVQQLIGRLANLGRLAALGWFISRFTDRLKPFVAILKEANRAGWNEECGTPFPARPVLADPNRVRDALLSLNHSKSYCCGSDFKVGQAHKHLHLTKYIYNEDIQTFSK